MTVSQQSYDVLKGRFTSGDTFIQGLALYDPKNPLIKKVNLTAFIAEVDAKDAAVTLKEEALKTLKGQRMKQSFRETEGADENCLENRMRNVYAYIGVEIGKDSGAYKKIGGYLKKIRPHYPKKAPDAPRGAGRSPSEKSYVALNGYATQMMEILTSLGVSYDPQNPYIVLATLDTFVKDMVTLTKDIAKAEAEYSNAAAERKVLYFGTEGVKKRESKIKDYLASFTGGKTSQNYIEYDRLIKGL